MQRVTPYQNYFGGKSGAGAYQQIINHIPPHRVFLTLYAGNCGIFKYIRPAEWSVINDIDKEVVEAWAATGIILQGDVKLSNKDARDFLRYDINDLDYYRQKQHLFIYLDPPYLMETRRSQLEVYRHEMSRAEHEDLLSLIVSRPDLKIMISHYPCELYDTMLAGWNTHTFESKTRKGMATERIYFNYDLDGKLHDYSYIGQNFRVREKYKRIKTNFFLKLDRMEPLLRNALLQDYDLKHRKKLR